MSDIQTSQYNVVISNPNFVIHYFNWLAFWWAARAQIFYEPTITWRCPPITTLPQQLQLTDAAACPHFIHSLPKFLPLSCPRQKQTLINSSLFSFYQHFTIPPKGKGKKSNGAAPAVTPKKRSKWPAHKSQILPVYLPAGRTWVTWLDHLAFQDRQQIQTCQESWICS